MPEEKAIESQADQATDLDAPKDTKGATETSEGSLLDTKPADSKDEPKGSSDEKKPEETPKKDEKPQGAPEKYADPKLPEGMTIAEPLKEKLDAEAKSLGLSQEKRDAFINLHVEAMQSYAEQTLKVFKETVEGWKQETIKALGTDYQKELAAGARAIDKALSDPKDNRSFRDLLSESGLGNHPLMVKIFNYFGKSIGESKLVEGQPGDTEKTVAEMMYPNLPPN